MSSRFALDGRVAVVTGAGSGLGRAIAHGLAEAGSCIAALDVDAAANAETVSAVGADAVACHVDVADRRAVDAAVDAVAARWGRIDIAVNCAGRGGRSPAVDYPDDLWDSVLSVNLTGTFNVCRAAGRHMLATKSGSIINIASIGGLVGYSGSAGYQASKGGVVQLTRALAIEWADRGVRVNAVAPSQFETAIVLAQWEAEPEMRAEFEARTPLGRIGQPAEIVGPVVFLASDAAAMITGHVLAVDGGYLAQ
jgi:NAD(P)-dependent dehydrogenase (short-subunit alcohol dehydrogenase family)